MNGKTILIVDDEVDMLTLLKSFFEKSGYDVLIACHGHEALEKVKQNPDLILLDVVMPGMDGFSVLERIRCDLKTKNIPVVMLTARGDSGSILKAQELEVTDFITKPCDPAELLELVKKNI